MVSNFHLQCVEDFLSFAGLRHAGYPCCFRMCQSGVQLKLSAFERTFVREHSWGNFRKENFREGTFARERSRRAIEDRTFAKGDLRGHRKERHF